MVWILQDHVQDDAGTSSRSRNKRIAEGKSVWRSNKMIEEFNDIATSKFANSDILLWKSAREISRNINDWRDYLHVGVKSCHEKANLVMNAICQKSVQMNMTKY